MKNLEVRTKKLEKINGILYDMIKKQNIEINTQNNLNEIDRLNKRFFLKNQEEQNYNNNSNFPLINNNNRSYQNSCFNEPPPPYYYNNQNSQALPYINEIERMINKYKMENEGYRKIRENETHIMRRIDEKINDFLLEETLKKNDNKYLRNQLKEMNDQLNFRLESIEHNQRVQRQKIDYIMKNYFINEKNKYKSNYRYKKDDNNDINKGNGNKSSIDISPSYHHSKKDSFYENDSYDKNRVYPYENSRRIFYKKIENGGK